MRPLHLRLVASDPRDPALAALAGQLAAAGHLVTLSDADPVPPSFPPTPDLVISEASLLPGGTSLDAAEARHIVAVLRLTGGSGLQEIDEVL